MYYPGAFEITHWHLIFQLDVQLDVISRFCILSRPVFIVQQSFQFIRTILPRQSVPDNPQRPWIWQDSSTSDFHIRTFDLVGLGMLNYTSLTPSDFFDCGIWGAISITDLLCCPLRSLHSLSLPRIKSSPYSRLRVHVVLTWLAIRHKIIFIYTRPPRVQLALRSGEWWFMVWGIRWF